MKTKEFLSQLKIAKAVIPSNSVLPILDSFCFIDGNVIGTDIEHWAIVETEIKKDFLVDAKIFLNVVKTIKTKELSIELSEDERHVLIKPIGVSQVFKLKTNNLDDFPKIPECETPVGKLTQKDAFNISNAIPALSDDLRRPGLAKVFVSKEYCATDAHVMVWGKIEGKIKKPILVTKKIAKLLKGEYLVYNDAAWVGLRSKGYTLMFRDEELKFPNYRAIIPKEHNILLTCDKKEFSQATAAVLTCCSSTTRQGVITLEEDGETMLINSKDLDFENEMSVEIPARYEVKSGRFKIGFNFNRMKRALSMIKDDTLKIKLSEENRAIVINDKVLIMPISISD